MVLRPVRRYRSELRRRKAIGARLVISYVASRGGRKLRTTTRAEFRK
jgi:hypothetical protein